MAGLTYRDPFSTVTEGLLKGMEYSDRQIARLYDIAYQKAIVDQMQKRKNVQAWEKSVDIINTAWKLAKDIPEYPKRMKVMQNAIRIASKFIPEWGEVLNILPQADSKSIASALKDINEVFKLTKSMDYDKLPVVWSGVVEKWKPYFPNLIERANKEIERVLSFREKATLGGLIPTRPGEGLIDLYGIQYKPIPGYEFKGQYVQKIKPDLQAEKTKSSLIANGERMIAKVFGVNLTQAMWKNLEEMSPEERIKSMEEMAGKSGSELRDALSNYYRIIEFKPELTKSATGIRKATNLAIKMTQFTAPERVYEWLRSNLMILKKRLGRDKAPKSRLWKYYTDLARDILRIKFGIEE